MIDPTPPYRGFLMLRDKRNPHQPYGWTESLWINRDSFETSLAALEEIADARVAILPKGFLIERLKVTNPLLPYALDDHPNYDQAGRYPHDARPAWTLLLLRFQHEGFSTRYNLGGVPNDVASAGGVSPSAEWQAALDRFAVAIKKHCVMVNKDREPRQNTPLLSVAPEGNALRITTTTDCFDASDVNQWIQVTISGVLEYPALNGDHYVFVIDRRNAITPNSTGVPSNVRTGSVAMREQKKVVNPISKVSILRVSSRKRGLGHGYPPPGRRKRR
ncbi:MAG TPA: hypothetical protein VKD72_08625 [Gemmataceae bacterium]|nr:hypothetical protein [Gemmataceae bacterium]